MLTPRLGSVEDLQLADWRERVARLYLSDVDLAGFRAGRDELFADHPQSPIPPAERAAFPGALLPARPGRRGRGAAAAGQR
ncbi:hypothetical protein GCM10027614_74990 [Micromonospora vulcania]